MRAATAFSYAFRPRLWTRVFYSETVVPQACGQRTPKTFSPASGIQLQKPVFRRDGLQIARSHQSAATAAGSKAKPAPFLAKGASMAAAASTSTGPEGPVVTPQWLHQHLGSVKILGASWYMPAERRDPFADFQAARVPGALFFDIEATADPTTDLPHMLPTEAAFSAAASALGLSSSDRLVVYDDKGIFSAARAWWMFRVFGHGPVWVLDGGLPAWRAAGFEVEAGPSAEADRAAAQAGSALRAVYDGQQVPEGSYKAKFQPELVRSYDEVLRNVEAKQFQVVDARGRGRFEGREAEPRPGLRGGHIPGSKNIPFPNVLTSNGTLKSEEDIREGFEAEGVALESPIVASCGTGVTACILAMALHRLGRKDVPVYDGSWTEWGLTQGAPVEVGSTPRT